MSRPQDSQRHNFPFGNPFRMIFPKQSYVSPQLQVMLSSFEDNLADKLKKMRPTDRNDVLSLSWMTLAMKSLCEIHTDIKVLITDLQFPVLEWDQKWMDVYLDNSVRLLDICIAFNSEISRLSQGQLLLQCVRHALDVSGSFPSSAQIIQSHSSLDEWMQQISKGNTRLESCTSILHGLSGSLYSPKIKDSAKGKVLMRAMYGVKVVTIFLCSVFASAFSGSSKTLMSLQVSDKLLWAKAFNDVQFNVNGEMRRLFSKNTTVLKELEAVGLSVNKLYPLTDNCSNLTDPVIMKTSVVDLGNTMERFTEGLDHLSKEVEAFFQIVLTGRDALLCNLRIDSSISDPKQEDIVKQQFVR